MRSRIHMLVIFIVLLLFSCGCGSLSYLSSYIEGTDISIGLMIPYNGSLYGFLAFHWLSGKCYKTNNTNDTISTCHSFTNSAWGTDLISTLKTEIR